MSCVCPAGQAACWPCVAKTLTLDITRKLFYHFFFIPAMSIGNIDFYYFIPLSQTLTMPGGGKVSVKQNLLASFSCTLFIWSQWNLLLKQFKLNFLRLLLRKISRNNGKNCCFTDWVKKLGIVMHSYIYKSIWFKLGIMIDAVILYILIQYSLTLTMNQSHRSAKKQELLRQLSVFDQFEWKLVY